MTASSTTRTLPAKTVRGALLAAAALLLAAPAPALAATAGDALPGNWLYLTVTKGDALSSDSRGTLLMCDPPQGHSRAAEACAQLAATDGDIRALPARDTFCPMIYAPVTTHARGQWNGRPVEYTQTFSSACVLAARTGAVFALDG
ncbi:SSI family serine proteinase inhibitor [Streptomyces sp. NPDC005574]|uniref:SSI family serine proteinase inhibitor n=1 Tax=Streptomyces sp. NPDC005574 TaxID=3156891 RepID=UPI0033BFB420